MVKKMNTLSECGIGDIDRIRTLPKWAQAIIDTLVLTIDKQKNSIKKFKSILDGTFENEESIVVSFGSICDKSTEVSFPSDSTVVVTFSDGDSFVIKVKKNKSLRINMESNFNTKFSVYPEHASAITLSMCNIGVINDKN